MSRDIILSQKHGVNPHMTFCQVCGKDANEIILTGASHLWVCSRCGMNHIGLPKHHSCQKCHSIHELEDRGEVPPETRLPASEPCTDCAHSFAICEEEVRNGGVPWRCKDCGAQGAIKANAPLAKEWRKKHDGKLVGLEVNQEQCPSCWPGKPKP